MFRENVLIKNDIIERVSETMIPVALDYQKVMDRTTSDSRFIRSLIKQPGDIQGVYVLSHRGKILGRYSRNSTDYRWMK